MKLSLTIGLAAAALILASGAWADGLSTTKEGEPVQPASPPASATPATPDAGKPAAKDTKTGTKSSDDGGLFSSQDNLVPLPTVIAPVLLNDRLNSDLYLYLAALTANAADAQQVKMRLPYVQDAMVRDVYDHMLTISNAKAEPNTAAMIARLKDVVNAAVGEPLVTELQVGRIDTAPY